MNRLAQILNRGGVGVLATDTLYGVVGRALAEAAVERVYHIKGRRPDKPFIILIGQIDDVSRFGIKLTDQTRAELDQYWPGPVSVILPDVPDKFEYLHRGGHTLAFRLPAKYSLRELLKQTGPLVAPSANPEAERPAQTIYEARAYFGDQVDFYEPGETTANPSKLIEITNGEVKVLRG